MLCCWEKTVEKKTITKPLLAESKSSASTGEPKIIAERKLTGFEPPLISKPEPKPAPVAVKVEPVVVKIEPKQEPVAIKQEPVAIKMEPVDIKVESKPEPKVEPVVVKSKPEPLPLPPKPTGPKPEAVPIPIPQKPVPVLEQEPSTFVEKNDFISKEKKNRSKSNKR